MAKEKNIEEETFTDDVIETNDEYEIEEVTIEERIANIEKKSSAALVIQVISLLLLVLILIFVLSNNTGKDSLSDSEGTDVAESEETYSYDASSFNKIAVNDISKESKNKKIVVLVARQGCSWCAKFAPVIASLQNEYDFTVQYIDLAEIIDFSTYEIADQDAYDKLIDYVENSDYADYVAKGIGTPLTLFIKNNKVVNAISGYTEVNELKSILSSEGFGK